MNPADSGTDASLEGLAVAAAVEAVVDGNADRDREQVRSALDHVAADGVVSRAAAEDAVGHAAKVVSTPETRVELAASALEDARATATPVADLDVVGVRLAEFDERLDALEGRVSALGETLSTVVDRLIEGDIYAVATGVDDVIAEANAVHRAADELSTDIEAFERWVADPETRADRLADDVDAVAETLDALEATADAVAGADPDTATVEVPDAGAVDPAVAWFDVAVRQRLVALLLADLRVEVADLETWANREGEDAKLEGVADRVDSLAVRREALADRVDSLARSDWTDRFGDRLRAAESRFDDLEPPVDWGEVRQTLEEHRSAVQ